MNKPSHRGFTLIELMVVVSIVGVLTTIFTASLSESRSRARDARRLLDMHNIETALNLYLADMGDLPDETAGSSWGGWEVSYLPDFMEFLGNHMPGTPVDPLNAGPAPSFHGPRPDGSYFYAYYYYNYPGAAASFGCPWNGSFAVLGFRSVEAIENDHLFKARCGPQMECPGGGINGVCRDWSNEFDYSVFVFPG